jgi:hypothetical protein
VFRPAWPQLDRLPRNFPTRPSKPVKDYIVNHLPGKHKKGSRYYLLNYDNSTRKLLSDFVKTLKETGGSKQAYDDTFEKVDVDKMQKSFEQFILKGK